jgi:Tfp pilus assembly protein PilN
MHDLNGLIAVAGTFLVVLIPVAGLTARFALKPVIEAFGRSWQMRQQNESIALLERRIALLEREVDTLREGKAFDDALAAGDSRALQG